MAKKKEVEKSAVGLLKIKAVKAGEWVKDKLSKIVENYKELTHNKDNYYIGGGRAEDKYVSRRHADARGDAGKLTLGEATALFKKATGLETSEVKKILQKEAREFHHAGRNPKTGKMKKVYFLNAEQIVDLAGNWEKNIKRRKEYEAEEKEQDELREDGLKKELKKIIPFLKKNTTPFERRGERKVGAIDLKEEMLGKNGWFLASYKYNTKTYYTGLDFKDEKSRKKYYELLKKSSNYFGLEEAIKKEFVK